MKSNPPPQDATQAERREIWRAHKAAERANARGLLHRPNGMEMHHPSYAAPLAVEYLTPAEHKRRHNPMSKRSWNRGRNPSDWTLFATSIQRSLPKSATWNDRKEAMREAGRLWRQGVRSTEAVVQRVAHVPAKRQRNPGPISIPREVEIPWLWVGGLAVGLYLLGRMQRSASATSS